MSAAARKNYRRRACVNCGYEFKGTNRLCHPCRTGDRTCIACGGTFRGDGVRCEPCGYSPRVCCACGKDYLGKGRMCRQCRYKTRDCTSCGNRMTGTNTRCWRCRARERACAECGRSYTGCHLKCPACFAPERGCLDCGNRFRGTNPRCTTCTFRRLPPDIRKALRAKYLYTRRARKYAARVAGPVPASVYLMVLASGPCVYCGAEATTVDHVTPLSRGGHEAEYNLAPACLPCNQSKSSRFLSEWKPERLRYALEHSMTVNTEYRRWRSEMESA